MRRADIIAEARSWLGTPYHHQASVKGVGCDCLGLVRGVYAAVMGVDPETPPPYSKDWAEARERETLLEAAGRHLKWISPDERGGGDVVVYRFQHKSMAKHAGILTARNMMIHAVEGSPVCEVHVGPWWERRFAAVYEFPGVQD